LFRGARLARFVDRVAAKRELFEDQLPLQLMKCSRISLRAQPDRIRFSAPFALRCGNLELTFSAQMRSRSQLDGDVEFHLGQPSRTFIVLFFSSV
jgi:hypothetical protein